MGNILSSLPLAPLSDLTCALAIVPDAIRQCRVGAVSSLALTGGNQASGVLSVVVTLLQPLLDMLSNLLQQLLNLLGLRRARPMCRCCRWIAASPGWCIDLEPLTGSPEAGCVVCQ